MCELFHSLILSPPFLGKPLLRTVVELMARGLSCAAISCACEATRQSVTEPFAATSGVRAPLRDKRVPRAFSRRRCSRLCQPRSLPALRRGSPHRCRPAARDSCSHRSISPVTASSASMSACAPSALPGSSCATKWSATNDRSQLRARRRRCHPFLGHRRTRARTGTASAPLRRARLRRRRHCHHPARSGARHR